MPRMIAVVLVAAVSASWSQAVGQGKHVDSSKIEQSCVPCHRGHGERGTAMLKDQGDDGCLGCHGAVAADGGQRAAMGMSASARPFDIEHTLSKPSRHRSVRCVDCHSIHGVELTPPGNVGLLYAGLRKGSPHRGFDDEASLCLSCHSRAGSPTNDPTDLGRAFNPQNPSYHPVLAPGRATAVPSLINTLTPQSIINCTDCHTSDEPSGPRGPHGSRHEGLLGARFVQEDGNEESSSTYELCYACHSRAVVLNEDAFHPYHRLHVVDERVSCATCHNPHGAADARALIRFNDALSSTRVNPSSSGLLRYESTTPGSGACYLSCHGKNHDPLGYGPEFSEDGRPRFEGGALGAHRAGKRDGRLRSKPAPTDATVPRDSPPTDRTPSVPKSPPPVPDRG